MVDSCSDVQAAIVEVLCSRCDDKSICDEKYEGDESGFNSKLIDCIYSQPPDLTEKDIEFLLNLVRHTDYWDDESKAEVKGAEARLEKMWKNQQ